MFDFFFVFNYNIKMIITSKNNENILLIKKLSSKQKRKSLSLFLVEGIKVCLEALSSNYVIKNTFVNSQKMYDFAIEKGFSNIIQIESSLFNSISDTVTTQGIISVCEYKQNSFVLPKGNSLILDNIQDPGNLGTLIRTAVASDFIDIYMINCVDFANDKVIRSSMGAIFKANLINTTISKIVEEKPNFNSIFLSADMSGENLFKTTFTDNNKYALIIGNEGNGIEQELFDISDKTISIPMQNNIESLNAGVSGSIIMYQIKEKI